MRSKPGTLTMVPGAMTETGHVVNWQWQVLSAVPGNAGYNGGWLPDGTAELEVVEVMLRALKEFYVDVPDHILAKLAV